MKQRTEYVAFYVTPSVREAIRRASEKSEQSQSKWLSVVITALLEQQGYEVSDKA